MVQYSILKETASGCVLQESFVAAYDAEKELASWRSLDPAGIYFIDEHEPEEPEYSEPEPVSADAPLFSGRYVGEAFESLQPGIRVAAYALLEWERERVGSSADFKILIEESGPGFFYAGANEIDVLADDVLAA